ncbi:MAG: RNA polymerase sigma factor [Kocuria sp.]|nr:RNA polymerase sigma factor [Kocuria sp.]
MTEDGRRSGVAESQGVGTPVTELDQATLVARAQDGDPAAFEQLVIRYEGPLYRYAFQMLGNRQEAEDVVQETMIRVWRALPGLDSAEAFSSWAYQITSRHCLDLLKKAGRRKTDATAPDDMPDNVGSRDSVAPRTPQDPAAVAESYQALGEITQLVSALSPPLRACWVMYEVHELTYGEIARALSITPATVRGRIARARAELVKGMTPWR